MDKQTALTQAIKTFENSERYIPDYMHLFIAVNKALKQGSGLVWTDVEQAIFNAFNELQMEDTAEEEKTVTVYGGIKLPVDETTFDLPHDPDDYDNPDDLPCYRQFDPDDGEWWCVYDHTGCLWNTGDNTCLSPGKTSYPLKESNL